jgi:hypothetical protein
MKELLINIAGLYSEDLTTEVLRIILKDIGYSVYQRLFYNYMFDNSINKNTSEYGFTIETQRSFLEGIPDIIIYDDNVVYIIENKFYAEFSQGNQILRYQNLLEEHFKKQKVKKIYLLVLKNRKPYYESELTKQQLKKEPQISFIIWEEVLSIFSSNNFLIESLSEYIKYKYLIELEITKEELMIYKNKNFANAINDLKILIEQTKDELGSMGFKTGRMSQSINYYGFMIENNNVCTWVGYGLQWWLASEEIITPLFMQIRDLFKPNPEFDDKFKKKLIELKFKDIGQEGWIKPYNTVLFHEKFKLVNEIKIDLDELTKYKLNNQLIINR